MKDIHDRSSADDHINDNNALPAIKIARQGFDEALDDPGGQRMPKPETSVLPEARVECSATPEQLVCAIVQGSSMGASNEELNVLVGQLVILPWLGQAKVDYLTWVHREICLELRGTCASIVQTEHLAADVSMKVLERLKRCAIRTVNELALRKGRADGELTAAFVAYAKKVIHTAGVKASKKFRKERSHIEYVESVDRLLEVYPEVQTVNRPLLDQEKFEILEMIEKMNMPREILEAATMHVNGYILSEIAEKLGMNPSTLRSRM